MVISKIRKKNTLFVLYYSVIIIFMSFPALFTLGNRVEPWILGLPFSIFYLLVCVGLLGSGLIVQFIMEDKLGELDLKVELQDETIERK